MKILAFNNTRDTQFASCLKTWATTHEFICDFCLLEHHNSFPEIKFFDIRTIRWSVLETLIPHINVLFREYSTDPLTRKEAINCLWEYATTKPKYIQE